MVPFGSVADDQKRLSRQSLFSLCALCRCFVSLLEHSFTCSTHCFVDLGFALSLSLAKRNCRIVLAGDAAQTRSVSQQIKSALAISSHGTVSEPDIVREVELDLHRAQEADVDAAVNQAWHAFGRIHVLLTCSTAPGSRNTPMEYTEGEWDETMAVNLRTPWLLTKSIARQMQQTGHGGSIIYVSSITGLGRGYFPGVSVHGAALAALHQLAVSLAMELGKYQISVMAIARGLTESDALPTLLTSEQAVKMASRIIPSQRWMNLGEDLEGLVIFLASDSAKYSTGNIFIVDGGQTLPRPRMRSYI
ncbi:unnamed protein product [Sphagnum jensenii]|uniref:Uncharacterized protein n=1 Tax=Sphagnum jensenii TaxID=128206 RepID=A0ABP1BFJ1_9BRYO